MKKVWRDGEKVPLLYKKRGQYFTRTTKGERVEATVWPCGTWVEEGKPLSKPENDWKKEIW
jgi:hypothetical protein